MLHFAVFYFYLSLATAQGTQELGRNRAAGCANTVCLSCRYEGFSHFLKLAFGGLNIKSQIKAAALT